MRLHAAERRTGDYPIVRIIPARQQRGINGPNRRVRESLTSDTWSKGTEQSKSRHPIIGYSRRNPRGELRLCVAAARAAGAHTERQVSKVTNVRHYQRRVTTPQAGGHFLCGLSIGKITEMASVVVVGRSDVAIDRSDERGGRIMLKKLLSATAIAGALGLSAIGLGAGAANAVPAPQAGPMYSTPIPDGHGHGHWGPGWGGPGWGDWAGPGWGWGPPCGAVGPVWGCL
jgi:hypothetical protein